MSLTKQEKREAWDGKGLIVTWWDKTRTFFLAKNREHWAAMKRFFEETNQKTGVGKPKKAR